MIPILLLLIALILPWIVHLAPPQQRPLAVVGAIAVIMLFGIFVKNPLPAWQFWAGLVVGVGSVVGFAMFAGGGGGARPRTRRAALEVDEDDFEA